MIETGLNDNQNIVLDYLKNSLSAAPFGNIHFLWDKFFDYCTGDFVSDEEAKTFEAYNKLNVQQKYEVLHEYGRWGINNVEELDV